MTARADDRLESLSTYGVIGGKGPDLADLVTLARRVADAPAGCIGFVAGEEMILTTSDGPDRTGAATADWLFTTVVESGGELVLPDIVAVAGSERPTVVAGARARAYVGLPLVGRDGLAIGVLAVFDVVPRAFSPDVLDALRTVARQVIAQLELSRLDAWGGRPAADSGFGPVRLREALEDGELVPYFQPVVDLGTGGTVGFEALLRWEHPDCGLIEPGRFLPTIEATGLMLPVGRHVLAEALGSLSILRRGRPELADLRMAVNASPAELIQREFATTVLDELAIHGLRPEALVIEITESIAFVDAPSAVRQLTELRDEGVRIALDDYGAGHSSLLRLLSLPLSVLKLDRQLTAGVAGDTRARAATRSTITMAHELGLVVVAEGIEGTSEREVLIDLGCQLGQGWLFGRPVPADRMNERFSACGIPTQAARSNVHVSDPVAV